METLSEIETASEIEKFNKACDDQFGMSEVFANNHYLYLQLLLMQLGVNLTVYEKNHKK